MSRKGRRVGATAELTPLIDVVFLLLIFFLVSSVFKKEELALLLNLPKSTSGKSDKQKSKSILIELSASEIAIDSKKISINNLESHLKELENKTLVNLRIDGEVKYDRVVQVLDSLQKNKLENLSLITNKNNNTKDKK